MKKIVVVVFGLLLVLSGCSGGSSSDSGSSSKASSEKTVSSSSKVSENKTYGLGEWWEVPSQWKLKIDSVTPTDERNTASDKTPEQVVIITYTYENLGYEGKVQDLFFSSFKVVDSGGKMAELYPTVGLTNPQPTPVGATCEGAQTSYGLTTSGGNIKISIDQFDGEGKKEQATFEVPVQ